MTSMETVGLYVALNLLLHCFLMLRIGGQRMKAKVNLGDGGDATLIGRIRAQGNYVENMPIALIALFALAMLSVSANVIHGFGAVFLLARLFHAHGITRDGHLGKGRTIGAALTLLTHLGAAGFILYKIFAG